MRKFLKAYRAGCNAIRLPVTEPVTVGHGVWRGTRFALLPSFALWALIILGVVSALAQEQPSPRERALLERINAEIGNNLTCSTNANALQDRMQKAERELEVAKKQLADKPNKDGPPSRK